MKKSIRITALTAASILCLGAMTACGGSSSSSSSSAASSASEASSASSAASSEASEASAASSSSASSADASVEKIVFGTNAEFAPFEYISAAGGVIGEYDGIDMAIAKAIGEELEADVSVENMEFDSLLIALQNGQIDAVIAGMTVTEERAKTVDFSTSYYTATQVMIVKEDSDITCASDMEGKNIAVVQGYTGETVVKDDLGYDYTAFKKGTECVLDLLNGKSDVVVIDSATAEKYVSDNEGLKIVEDPDAFGDEQYAIAVNKDNPELLSQINVAIEKLLEDGTVSEISAEYIDAE